MDFKTFILLFDVYLAVKFDLTSILLLKYSSSIHQCEFQSTLNDNDR